MEKINITNKNSHVSIEYNPIDRKSLSDILRDNNILLPTPCGGHGVCGKCRVTITSPELSDVIACKYYPTQSIEATLITPVYTSAIEEQIYQSPEQTTEVRSEERRVGKEC